MALKLYFAPMEGITDRILRKVHHEIFGGIDVYCLPFHKLTHTMSLLTREKHDVEPSENAGLTVLPQALTRDPNQLIAWLEFIGNLGYTCADLNLGCPSPTVTKRGRGSGLLHDPGYLSTFLDYVFSKELPVSLSVKTRIGYESPDEWPRIAGILADFPFHHITIHVRTTKEQYSSSIHPEAFQLAMERNLPSPVFNGDIRTKGDVVQLLKRIPETGAIMIGRGLLANPALARELQGGLPAKEDELISWYFHLYQGWTERFGAAQALGRIKKLMEWPSAGDIHKARLLRRANDIDACIQAVI